MYEFISFLYIRWWGIYMGSQKKKCSISILFMNNVIHYNIVYITINSLKKIFQIIFDFVHFYLVTTTKYVYIYPTWLAILLTAYISLIFLTAYVRSFC